MKRKQIKIALLALSLAGLMNAHAGLTLNFEDLASPVATGTPMPTAYGADGIHFGWSSGWLYAAEGGNTFVFNGGSGDVAMQLSGGTFTFEGADFAGTGTVTVQGYAGAILVGSETYTLSSAGFISYGANLENINRLVFIGTDWRMDNFVDSIQVVPEPTTVAAAVLLLLPFGASTIRILRRGNAA